jgi:hypothetical protein
VGKFQVILIAYLFTISHAYAQIPAVVNITINGQTHQVTELIAHRHYPQESYTYKTLDSIYTLTINKQQYIQNKPILKYVPDNRPFYIKHPILHYSVLLFNTASMIMNIIQLVRI